MRTWGAAVLPLLRKECRSEEEDESEEIGFVAVVPVDDNRLATTRGRVTVAGDCIEVGV